MGTDHYLVKAKYKCRVNSHIKPNLSSHRKVNISALKEQEIKNRFEEVNRRELEKRKDELGKGIETSWTVIRK